MIEAHDTLSKEALFILPFLGHFLLICGLYAWLTVERQLAVFNKEVRIVDFVKAGADPERSMRIARNLSNQFELPVFALFAAALIYVSHKIGAVDIAAAWLFLAGRLIHTFVQTLTRNVPLRGIVFTINFVAVVILIGRLTHIVLQ